jgi:hypothetical protein
LRTPQPDSGSSGRVRFEDRDGVVRIEGALQPNKRDVIFGRCNSGGIVGGFRKWNEARVGETGDGRSAFNSLTDVAAGIDWRLGRAWQ